MYKIPDIVLAVLSITLALLANCCKLSKNFSHENFAFAFENASLKLHQQFTSTWALFKGTCMIEKGFLVFKNLNNILSFPSTHPSQSLINSPHLASHKFSLLLSFPFPFPLPLPLTTNLHLQNNLKILFNNKPSTSYFRTSAFHHHRSPDYLTLSYSKKILTAGKICR